MTKRNCIVVVLVLSMVFALSACTKTPEPAPVDPLSFPVTLSIPAADLPVIDGALACLPYYEETASLVTGLPIEEARTYVLSNNTPASFRELAEGTIDLGFLLHASAEQDSYAKQRGVSYAYAPYAKDAFVFFVNRDNPVESVTMAELKDIYAGKITNWKEVGGRDEPIIAYQRNEGSGSQTGLYEYVISPDEVMDPPTEIRIGTMGGIIDAVAHYENAAGALGYSYLYFVTNQHYDEDIKLLKVDGYAPDEANIRAGKYPMVTEYCLVTREGEATEGSYLRQIIDWCLSDQGQALAKKLSYIPVTANAGTFVAPSLPDMIRTPLHAPFFSVNGNNLTVSDIRYEENDRSGNYVQISGLADKAVEMKVNRTIRNAFFDLIDDDSIPAYRGSAILEKKYEFVGYDGFYVYTMTGMNAENLFSVAFNQSRYYSSTGEWYTVGREVGLTFDLSTGELLKITDLFADPDEGIRYLNGKVQDVIERHETENEETGWFEEGEYDDFRLSGSFPGIREDQRFFLSENGSVALILDEATPWVRTNSFEPTLLAVPATDGIDLTRFGTAKSLFEDKAPNKKLLYRPYPLNETLAVSEWRDSLFGKDCYYNVDITYYKSMPKGQLATLPITEESRAAFINEIRERYEELLKEEPDVRLSSSVYGYVSRVGNYTNVYSSESCDFNVSTPAAYRNLETVSRSGYAVYRGDSETPITLGDVFRAGVDVTETMKKAAREGYRRITAENGSYRSEDPAAMASFEAYLDDIYGRELTFSVGTDEIFLMLKEGNAYSLADRYSETGWELANAGLSLRYSELGIDNLAIFE